MKQSIRAAVAAKPAATVGAFVSGCIVHCQTIFNEGQDRWNAWQVGGRKPHEVFHSFFFGGGEAVAIDDKVYRRTHRAQSGRRQYSSAPLRHFTAGTPEHLP